MYILCWHINVQQFSPSVTILKNEKEKFETALRKYLHTHSFYSVDALFMCKDDSLYFCKMFIVYYTVNLYICVFMTCLYETLMDLWTFCLYVCMYVCMYEQMVQNI